MTTTYSTFRTDTQTVTIGADPARVFEFVSTPKIFPGGLSALQPASTPVVLDAGSCPRDAERK